MERQEIDFATFKENFIQQPDGYFSVHSFLEENNEGEYLKVVKMDMICEWRLTDGKVKFIEVPFETKEQFNEIVEYLKVTAELLNRAILKNISGLVYEP